MGLVGKLFGSGKIKDGVPGSAIVVEPDARPFTGGTWRAEVGLVVDPDGAPTPARTKTLVSAERWAVAGQRVPVTIERSDPSRARIEWDEVPPIDERVAAGDPTLVDPLAARAAARAAMEAAGVAPDGGEERDRELAAELEGQLERARTAPAPEGKLRGVAVRVSIRTPSPVTTEKGEAFEGDSKRGSGIAPDQILSVHVPGRDPYAVRTGMRRDRRRQEAEVMPVLVDESDPRELEVIWEELPPGHLSLREIRDAKKPNEG